jgi:glycogenin glucosyltransferase
MTRDYAAVTLLTDDRYLPGALTAVHSLYDVEGAKPAVDFDTVCLVTPATVSVEAIKRLRQLFTLVVGVDSIETSSHRELALLGTFLLIAPSLRLTLVSGRPELKLTLTKLHLWRLTQYKKLIYLDADTLILRPISHLFTTTPKGPRALSAAPDIGWPDCFNSGLMVLTPDQQTFEDLKSRASSKGSWE